MSPRRIGARCVLGVWLGSTAPLAVAQVALPGGPGMHGRGHGETATADCRKQADDQKLPPGDERQKFLRRCSESKRDDSDAAKAAAARAKMADPQSGHLHSDLPGATAPK